MMPNRYLPGATIGIIGSSMASALLAQAAGRLGYRVASLVLEEKNPVRQFASWQTVVETDTYNENALRFFAERVDTISIETGILSNSQIQLLNELTELAMTNDLIALTTDRVIEKAFLDKEKCLVAPYSLVTSIEDIKEAIEYIGFPSILKATQRHIEGANDHVILYSEEDYDKAIAKLEKHTAILEAWIPSERKVSVTVVRNERGEILIYPPFEVIDGGDSYGKHVRYPANIDETVEREINRIGQMLAESLALTGTLTVKFFVTSAGVLYINEASIGLGDEAIFTLGSMSLNHYEATVRGLVGLPLPNLYVNSPAAIALPVQNLNKENVYTQLMLRTDWGFALFNPMGNEEGHLEGQVIVTGDSIENCERQIQLTEITKIEPLSE